METSELVNLYTLCSDVQRNADDLRQNVRSLLLDRLHHDQPVHGQYGSVQRTSRRNRRLKDDETVLERLEDQGIDRERVTTVDTSKVDEALEVTGLSESDLYGSTKASTSTKPMSTKRSKNLASRGSKINLRLSTRQRQPNSSRRSKTSKLESRNSPVSDPVLISPELTQ